MVLLLLFLASTLACPGFEQWYEEFEDSSVVSQFSVSELESNFCTNMQRIREYQMQMDETATYTVGWNQYTGLSPAQFSSLVLMPPRQPPALPEWRYSSPQSGDIPDSFDWRYDSNVSVVTAVRDQGTTGTCWAFSTAQNVEGIWALGGNTLVELSVEQIVDCCSNVDPTNLHADCGVFGGWPYLTYPYIIQVGGLETEAQYPYCCGSGKCFPCAAPGYNRSDCGPPPPGCNSTQNKCTGLTPAAKIQDWVAISKDEDQMASELISRGPLSVLIDAQGLDLYKSGVWNPKYCDPTYLDHAVLLVGYGVDNSTTPGTPFWTVKNSWGPNWGEEGYFRIIRGEGKCGINTAVTSATYS